MKYKLIQKGNPSNPNAPKKWFAIPINSGTVEGESINREIANMSALTEGDCESVITNVENLFTRHLMAGKSVELGNLGSFRLSFSSEGTETKEEFHTSKIRDIKIIYNPNKRLKRKIKELHFEKTK